MNKKRQKFYYYVFLIEEGVAYYLTYKWSLVFFAGLIAIFPTILVEWLLRKIWLISASWQIVFFVIWAVILIFLLYEFQLPANLKLIAKKASLKIKTRKSGR
jgi:hypothetical protein